MNIYKYLKSLTLKERTALAEEVGTKQSYLNYLASQQKNISIEMAEAILNSDFNKSLPDYQQFTEEAYTELHQERIRQKTA